MRKITAGFTDVKILAGKEIFLIPEACSLGLGPTQPPLKWVPGGSSHGGRVATT